MMKLLLIAAFALFVSAFILSESAFADQEENKVTFTVNPNFPDPRLIEIPQMSFVNGVLTVEKLDSNSVLDLVFEGRETIQDSKENSFVINEAGCYWVEEEGQFSMTKSNHICLNRDGTAIDLGHPFKNWVEKREFSDLENDVTLIVLPVQEDLRFASACPQSYSEMLQACYRNHDGSKFIITTQETISPFVIEHELKHAECDCNYHD